MAEGGGPMAPIPRYSGKRRHAPSLQLMLAGAALAVLWAVATTVGPFSDTTVNDLYVYRTYADLLVDGQLPYFDFGFEYPPLAALPLGLAGIFGTDEPTYAVSFGVLMAGCALVGQQLAARLAGGAREGVIVAWLLALAPIVIGASVRTHFDALPIALALGGLLALARERPELGFALLGLGTMTKLFPGLLAVLAFAWLLSRGERRGAFRGGAIFVAIVLAISLPFAGSGYVDSFTFHLDRPVQIESTPATVLFALGGSDVTGTNLRPDRFKSNGLDGGHAEAVAAAVLAAARRGARGHRRAGRARSRPRPRPRRGLPTRATSCCAASPRCWHSSASARSSRRSTSSGSPRSPPWRGCGATAPSRC